MLKLQPNILERDGKKAFAVLTYEEFLGVQEALEDYADLCELREAKAAEFNAPDTPLSEVRQKLGI